MTEIWHCPVDWAAWLTGSLFGLFVGGGIGWYLRSCYFHIEPVEWSQQRPLAGPSEK